MVDIKKDSHFSDLDDHIFFASESVGEGHPDKMCDQVSDGILDACLRFDPNAKVAMETATKSEMVSLKINVNDTFVRLSCLEKSVSQLSKLTLNK